MEPGQIVDSYKFWDIVSLWARETLQHESVVARALAHGVIRDGLRMYSVDPRWFKADKSLRGYPYVGFCALPESMPIILRAEALEHLLAVVRKAAEPSRQMLTDEFVSKADSRAWLESTSQPLPSFWFSNEEKGNVA